MENPAGIGGEDDVGLVEVGEVALGQNVFPCAARFEDLAGQRRERKRAAVKVDGMAEDDLSDAAFLETNRFFKVSVELK